MASLNKVFLIGNLTRDPEIRYTPSGKAVGDLRLAVNRRFKTAEGENRDETCFVNVVVWGRQAETCGEYLRKGSPLLAEGRLQYDEWEKDGQKHNRLRVVAERVQFLSSPRGAEFRDGSSKENADNPEARQAPAPAEPADSGGDDDNLPF
jgi:single-strand DNA-binding protein